MEIDRDSAGVKFPPPLVFIGGLAAGLILDHFLIFDIGIPLGGWLENTIGWIAFVAGAAIMLTAIGLFRKAKTNPEPWKPSTALVTDGVYRWTRNPMYLGMALVYLGIAFLCDSLMALVTFVPVFFWITREVIEREEAYMTAKFGDEYRAYRESTGRWF